MPIFEYRCDDCGHVTEFLEPANARRKHACEGCGSEAVSKVFSTFAAQAKAAAPPACPSGGCCESGSCPMARK